jgi:hypothetical protein
VEFVFVDTPDERFWVIGEMRPYLLECLVDAPIFDVFPSEENFGEKPRAVRDAPIALTAGKACFIEEKGMNPVPDESGGCGDARGPCTDDDHPCRWSGMSHCEGGFTVRALDDGRAT